MMLISAIKVTLYLPWAHSLKDKRMVVQSILAKLRHHFHLSAAEVARQDLNQTAVIATAAIVPDQKTADQLSERIIHFIEENCEAQITDICTEIR